jgi:DNA-binding NarL/FixJ family response regulator
MIFESVKDAKSQVVPSAGTGKGSLKNKKDQAITLTTKELEVLKYVAEGLRNKEIADKLFNSEGTIKKHISNMFEKMDVKNRLSLITRSKEEGILVD